MLKIAVVVPAEAGAFRPEGLFDGVRQFGILVHAQQQVDLRDFLQQVARIPLAEAAGDGQHFAAAGFLVLGHFQNRIDGFLLGRIDKTAGIDQQNIRFLRPVGQEEAPVLQQAQRRFGIHPVLVASEGNGPNGIRHMTRFPFCFLVSHEGV